MEHGNKNSAVSNIADQINDAKWKNVNKMKHLGTKLSILYIIILTKIFSSFKVYEILLFMRIKIIFVILIIHNCELFPKCRFFISIISTWRPIVRNFQHSVLKTFVPSVFTETKATSKISHAHF